MLCKSVSGGKVLIVILLCIIIFPVYSFCQTPVWHQTKGIENDQLWALHVYQKHPDTLYAAGLRFYISTDGGENWKALDTVRALGRTVLKTDPNNSKIIYGLIFPSFYDTPPYAKELHISYDGGITWKRVFALRTNIFLEVDPIDNRTIYISPIEAVLKSSDYGNTWDTLSTLPVSINDLRISRSNNHVIFAGWDNGINKTTDKGITWNKTSFSIKTDFVEIDPSNPDIVYAAAEPLFTNNVSYVPTELYKTRDGGASWVNISQGLTGNNYKYISSIIINPKNTNELFLGFAGGVFDTTAFGQASVAHSTDGGLNWTPYSNGIPDSSEVTSMDIDTVNNKLLATVIAPNITHKSLSGVYILNYVTEVASEEKNSPIINFQLMQNFPNPFNPTTTISYSIPEDANVRLKVYDILGKEVITLVNRNETAGIHKVNFTAFSLPSGIYIYRIEAGSFTDSKRLLLLK
ncbi:MAG: T9SS type A sorting domain-containing protein [Clostridiales bacterium]